MHYYRAFELNIASEIRLEMLTEIEPFNIADVTVVHVENKYLEEAKVCHADDIEDPEPDERRNWLFRGNSIYAYRVPDGAVFVIENGNKISVINENESIREEMLAVYILGGCMGILLQQKGRLLIHGSCVARDGAALVIMGWCGAGKSTTAREFLRNGWKLITDDVTAIDFSGGRPQAVPSYPSQKLWEDAIEHYEISGDALTPLWQERRKEKFHVSAEDAFCNEKTDLKYALWLVEGSEESELAFGNVEGFAKVDRLMRNFYALSGRSKEAKAKILQEYVDLSEHVRVFECVRPAKRDTVGEIYEKITAMIEDR